MFSSCHFLTFLVYVYVAAGRNNYLSAPFRGVLSPLYYVKFLSSYPSGWRGPVSARVYSQGGLTFLA